MIREIVNKGEKYWYSLLGKDPEEAITAAIDYLVDNNLIK